MLPAFAAEQRQLCRGTRLTQMAHLREWTPVGLATDPLALIWRWVGEQRFNAPFFADNLRGQAPEQRLVCHTNVEETRALLASTPHLPPSAFIFHASRCGSTLLTQMLSCLPHCLAISEPPVLESCLQYYYHQPLTPLEFLQAVVAALGQQRFPEQRHYIIKLDSWHLCQLPLLRAAFPDTPFYFLYRQPAQILVSHMRQPGPQMVPGLLDPARLGIDSEIPYADHHAWGEMFLMRLFSLAQHYAENENLHLLNYQDLPSLLWNRLLLEWQIDVSKEQLQQIQQRSQFHAKNMSGFVGDPPAQREVSRNLFAQYEILETIRAKT